MLIWKQGIWTRCIFNLAYTSRMCHTKKGFFRSHRELLSLRCQNLYFGPERKSFCYFSSSQGGWCRLIVFGCPKAGLGGEHLACWAQLLARPVRQRKENCGVSYSFGEKLVHPTLQQHMAPRRCCRAVSAAEAELQCVRTRIMSLVQKQNFAG